MRIRHGGADDAPALLALFDCWAGVPELPAQYERLGFTRTGSFSVGDWPGAILVRAL